VSADAQPSPEARTFILVAIGVSLPAWEICFELGAFETISYRRILALFVVATVVLIAAVGGWYVGAANDRFLLCSDFELVGDYVPPNCTPG
jgi:putative Mn2+ efflux pump MntP